MISFLYTLVLLNGVLFSTVLFLIGVLYFGRDRLRKLSSARRFRMWLWLDILFRFFQLVSYALAAYSFFKYWVLPLVQLYSKFVGSLFSVRNPEVHWPGRSGVSNHVVVMNTPRLEAGGFEPVRRGHQRWGFLPSRDK